MVRNFGGHLIVEQLKGDKPNGIKRKMRGTKLCQFTSY